MLKQRCRPVSRSVHICNGHVLEFVGSEETNGLPAVFGALTVVARLSLHIALHMQICIDRTIRILYTLTPLPYGTLMGFASLSVVFIPTILFSVSVATRIEQQQLSDPTNNAYTLRMLENKLGIDDG